VRFLDVHDVERRLFAVLLRERDLPIAWSTVSVNSGARSPTCSWPPRAEFQSGLNGKTIIAIDGTCDMMAPKDSGGWRVTA
jgi:hypothetical protein